MQTSFRELLQFPPTELRAISTVATSPHRAQAHALTMTALCKLHQVAVFGPPQLHAA